LSQTVNKEVEEFHLVREIAVMIYRRAFQTMDVNQNTGRIVHKKYLLGNCLWEFGIWHENANKMRMT
jgi:hypothetical protein